MASKESSCLNIGCHRPAFSAKTVGAAPYGEPSKARRAPLNNRRKSASAPPSSLSEPIAATTDRRDCACSFAAGPRATPAPETAPPPRSAPRNIATTPPRVPPTLHAGPAILLHEREPFPPKNVSRPNSPIHSRTASARSGSNSCRDPANAPQENNRKSRANGALILTAPPKRTIHSPPPQLFTLCGKNRSVIKCPSSS